MSCFPCLHKSRHISITFIPYGTAGATYVSVVEFAPRVMSSRGIIVSIKSDSADEAHHLNHEAAKTMKWGGLSETDALKLITLNPAIQLGIANRVGSIEVGKDADLTIWNGNPLSIFSVVQKVLIDGTVYFDRQQDRIRRLEVEKEKKSVQDRKPVSINQTDRKGS